MATTKGTFTHYSGPLPGLPSTNSPGFLFLSTYIAGIDALDRSSPEAKQLLEILSPTATFTNNGGDSLPLSKVEAMFAQRQGMLQLFEHGSPVVTWDLETEGGGRTVVLECASKTVFKADPKKEEVKVAECLFVKLESAPEGKGVAGLWATELRVYMDFGTIHLKGKELMDLAKK
ncbi:hypothetical protein BGZ57DRAFT_904528 [Hyaloscypha finlandica]|nr:hypothetical protein BGZ57DRAFT_904528 [Hyaloscypha finlandica]KAH8791350.1 hypothetical protein F5882DRAFT_437969 [Hyaloscypha sp. PMI_1271]